MSLNYSNLKVKTLLSPARLMLPDPINLAFKTFTQTPQSPLRSQIMSLTHPTQPYLAPSPERDPKSVPMLAGEVNSVSCHRIHNNKATYWIRISAMMSSWDVYSKIWIYGPSPSRMGGGLMGTLAI